MGMLDTRSGDYNLSHVNNEIGNHDNLSLDSLYLYKKITSKISLLLFWMFYVLPSVVDNNLILDSIKPRGSEFPELRNIQFIGILT